MFRTITSNSSGGISGATSLRSLLKLVPALLLAFNTWGAVSVSLNYSAASVPVGTSITFTADASDSSNSAATFLYRFSVRHSGTSAFAVVKDYYRSNTLVWSDTSAEGSYDVRVIALSSSGQSGSEVKTVTFTSRVTGTVPVVNPTQNPLVALYSAPPCSSPKTVRVRFKRPADNAWHATPSKACNGLSVNFLIAGMYPNATYTLQQDLYNGPFDTPGPQLSFRTGSLPPNVNFPVESTSAGPTAPTSISYPFIIEARQYYPWAHDLAGNIVWYSQALSNSSDTGTYLRPTNSGTFLALMDDPNLSCPANNVYCGSHEFLREYDLAGSLIRETSWPRINTMINQFRAAHGKPAANITWISHEGYRLPNGYTATIVTDQRVANQGQGLVDVLGDAAVVLDTNFQVVWEWDAFDNLNITRQALLGDTCGANQAECPPLLGGYTKANDWTHMNSVTYDPSDGNLVISIRSQSWVVKAAYQNGSGDGHTIWTLGMNGNFALASGATTNDWFSYQHDVGFQANGLLTVFDNGNYRVAKNGGGDSRGQAWSLDLSNMTATPVENFDAGFYSFAVGYASLLSNGNYDFSAGCINSCAETQSVEFSSSPAPAGTVVYRQQMPGSSYRSIRVPDLYTER